MLFRIPQVSLCRLLFQPLIRNCRHSTQIHDIPRVKVLSIDEDNSVKITFRYGNSTTYGMHNFKVGKEQTLEDVFKRIKLIVSLHKRKEDYKRSILSKYTATGDSVMEDVETDDNDIDVSVIKDNAALDVNIRNEDAWIQGQILKIGDKEFEIHYNAPSVLQLTLPENIIVNCPFRPHFIFECAEVEDSEFHWYRSKSPEEMSENENQDDNWVKISEGLVYQATGEDVGHYLKVICIPKNGNRVGPPHYAISKNEVETGFEVYPFEERQNYTQEVVDSDCIRCISYNILANIYVETRRFPYCSRKARDIYFRKQLLLRELPGYNADIICLQEVQERVFDYDILPVMKKLNIDGFFNKKGGKRHDGLGFLYRTTKFKILKTENLYLNTSTKRKDIFTDVLAKVSGNLKDMSKLLAQDTVLQLVLIQHIDQPTKKILVANTHLYSNKDMPEVRLFQAALCTSYIEYRLKEETTDEPIGIIFCGDFNSLPDSTAYQLMSTGSFKCLSSWKNSSAVEDVDMTLRHNLALSSACGTPPYTNYTEDFFGCLDYIFYSHNDFHVSEVVPFPPHEKITEQVALPSEYFPSDHIPLICTLKWKSWNSN